MKRNIYNIFLMLCSLTLSGCIKNTVIDATEKNPSQTQSAGKYNGTYKGFCTFGGEPFYEITATLKDAGREFKNMGGLSLEGEMEIFPTENNPYGSCGAYHFKGTETVLLFTPDNNINLYADKYYYYSEFRAGQKIDNSTKYQDIRIRARYRDGGYKGTITGHGMLGCDVFELTRTSKDDFIDADKSRRSECEARPIPKCEPKTLSAKEKSQILSSCNKKVMDLATTLPQNKLKQVFDDCEKLKACSIVGFSNRACEQRILTITAMENAEGLRKSDAFVYLLNTLFLRCDATGVKGYLN